MTITDEGVGYEEVVPVPRQPPPPPPGARPVVNADGTMRAAPVQKRNPIPRGTYALGGGAIAGTLLLIVGFGAGAVAVIATAAGIVTVPLAVWRRRKNGARSGQGRQRRSRTQRTQRTRRAQTRTGLGGWSPGGLGGGGRRSRGGSGSGSPVGGTTGRARGRGATSGTGSGGMPSLTGKSKGRGRAATSGSGMPGLGRGAGSGRGRGAGWSPFGGAGGGRGRGRGGRSRFGHGRVRGPGGWSLLGSGSGHGAKLGKGAGKGKGSTSGTKGAKPAVVPAGGRGGARGAWNPNRHPRALQRGAARVNGSGYRLGGSFGKGVRQPTAGRAFTRAYQQHGKRGHNPTMTGKFARVAGGLSVAVPAWTARAAWNATKRIARADMRTARAAYRAAVATYRHYRPKPVAVQPPQPTPPPNRQGVPPARPAPGGPRPTARPTAQPTPPPARPAPGGPRPTARPAPQPTGPRPTAPPTGPAPVGNPVPVGAGAGTNSGGPNTMALTAFPPLSGIVDFYAAAQKWSPGSDDGAIWRLQAALPLMEQAMLDVTNGWSVIVKHAEEDLQGGLRPHMRGALAQVWVGLRAAAASAGELKEAFNVAYDADIARQNTKGGNVLNV